MIDQPVFTVPGYEEVAAEARPVFDQLKKSLGKVPNLYATIGYSANALASYMSFVQAQAKNTFHAKEREAIYLIVSELNGCPYCLAAHTQSAIKNRWTEEETLQLRAGTLPDPKWKAIYRLIQSILNNKGAADAQLVKDFYAAGYNQAAIIDVMVLVNIMSFTNYVYRLTEIPIDFPLAKPIASWQT